MQQRFLVTSSPSCAAIVHHASFTAPFRSAPLRFSYLCFVFIVLAFLFLLRSSADRSLPSSTVVRVHSQSFLSFFFSFLVGNRRLLFLTDSSSTYLLYAVYIFVVGAVYIPGTMFVHPGTVLLNLFRTLTVLPFRGQTIQILSINSLSQKRDCGQ